MSVCSCRQAADWRFWWSIGQLRRRGRIVVGAALSALLIGLGANAILKRVERHPPPPSAEANQQGAPAAAKAPTAAETMTDPWPASVALVTGKEEAPSPALTAAPAAANASSPNSTEAAPAGPAVPSPLAKAVPDALAEKHASRSKFARTPSPIQTRVGGQRGTAIHRPCKEPDWRSVARQTFRLWLASSPPGLKPLSILSNASCQPVTAPPRNLACTF